MRAGRQLRYSAFPPDRVARDVVRQPQFARMFAAFTIGCHLSIADASLRSSVTRIIMGATSENSSVTTLYHALAIGADSGRRTRFSPTRCSAFEPQQCLCPSHRHDGRAINPPEMSHEPEAQIHSRRRGPGPRDPGDGANHFLRRRGLSRTRFHHRSTRWRLRAVRLQRPRRFSGGRSWPLGGVRRRGLRRPLCGVAARKLRLAGEPGHDGPDLVGAPAGRQSQRVERGPGPARRSELRIPPPP